MPPALYASIDVGTNTVKMAIGDLADGGAAAVFDRSASSRLGEGMSANGARLSETAMARTADAIADFAQEARAQQVLGLAAVGTAALRDAQNRDEFLARVMERCGVAIDVISGEEEARLSFLAVRRDPHWRGLPNLLVIDIGGGSSEIIQGEPGGDRIAQRRSVNLGAVKVTERYLLSDPPTAEQIDAAQQAVSGEFAAVAGRPEGDWKLVGVGGTLTNLGSMDLGGWFGAEVLHGHALTAEALQRLIDILAVRTVAERRSIPGLDPARADIILGGAILAARAAERVGADRLDISTRGLRWGVLYDRFRLR
jgi:exopolyphosphatase/guanosine-5'-triphosphate,3'-diphosphate pyrophosphatase